jgi:hypothetical protein
MSEMAPLLASPGPADARIALRKTVAEKIAENHLGEQISFDLGLILLAGPGQPAMAAYLLILSMRSPLMSPPRIAVPHIIEDGYPSESQVGEAVKAALAGLYEVRQKLLRGDTIGGIGHPGAN